MLHASPALPVRHTPARIVYFGRYRQILHRGLACPPADKRDHGGLAPARRTPRCRGPSPKTKTPFGKIWHDRPWLRAARATAMLTTEDRAFFEKNGFVGGFAVCDPE